MTLPIAIVTFIFGVITVYIGAEGLVRGASRLAMTLGVRPVIIGLTIVAFGTSSPEFGVSLMATLQKTKDVALGNIIGSNIANIGLVLGVAALIRPLKVQLYTLKRDLPFMIMVAALLFVMASDRKLNSWDGFILFSGIVLFTFYLIFISIKQRNGTPPREEKDGTINRTRISRLNNSLLVFGGLLGLGLGSHLILKAALTMAKALQVNELVIGLSIVAFGTSLPELATSIVGSYRKEADICIGNVIGSNLFNTLFVLGIIALLSPLTVDSQTLTFDFPAMMAFSLILFPMMKTGMVLNRLEGALLVGGYIGFIFFVF